MRITKVKIFTSKTSYKELEREVNEFIATLDNVKTIEYQDTQETVSCLVSYLEDKKEPEVKSVTNHYMTKLTASNQHDLCQMIAAQLEDKFVTVNIKTYIQGGTHHAELTRV